MTENGSPIFDLVPSILHLGNPQNIHMNLPVHNASLAIALVLQMPPQWG
jgi:hypothetical protein